MQADDRAEPTHQIGEAMQSLHPDQISVLRIRAVLASVAALIVGWVLDIGLLRQTPTPEYALPGVVLLAALYFVLIYPARRHRSWGYAEGEDELAIRSGILVQRRTIVPFGRVQHIDVAQGPIQRPWGIATLTLHTAGTRGAEVSLPGLEVGLAEEMRDRIRGKIRQDLV
ncbi:MAG TPA: PH domain-containing protein [Allosphingosinicella sp.]|nr:PH domain-containing protein [Allosphingosinicella sp.]